MIKKNRFGRLEAATTDRYKNTKHILFKLIKPLYFWGVKNDELKTTVRILIMVV